MTDTGTTAAVDHANAITDIEGFALRAFLRDGNRLTVLHADGKFDTLTVRHLLFGSRSSKCANAHTGEGRQSFSAAGADLITGDTTCNGSNHRTCSGPTLKLHIANFSDGSGSDGLGLPGFLTGISITGELLRNARGEHKRKNGEGK